MSEEPSGAADLDLTLYDLIGLAIAGVMIVLLAGRGAQPPPAREAGAGGARR